MSGYLIFLDIYGINIDSMGALDSTRVAENVLLQCEDRASLASKHSRTPFPRHLLTVDISEGFHAVDA